MVLVCLLTTGCALSVQVASTQRPAIEQELLVRSLERAVAGLDVKRFSGRRVLLDLHGLTPDQGFAKEFLIARMRQQGVDIVSDEKQAELRLKVFASVLGVDRGDTLLGLPATVAPLVGITVPEIALFKWVRNRGHTEVEIYAFDGQTQRFVDKVPASVGRSKYDQFTVLVVISFTWSDLDEPPK